jgi:flagellar basal body-associated protein FliL
MANDRPLIVETGGRSSGAGWIVALVLVVALVVGIVFFSQMSNSQTAKDNAITNTNAAGQVGDAAQKAGNAAQDAADNTKK